MGLLADEVRGKSVNEALNYLRFSPRKRTATDALHKLLKSATANADQKGTVDVDNLFVKTILVGQGRRSSVSAQEQKVRRLRLTRKPATSL